MAWIHSRGDTDTLKSTRKGHKRLNSGQTEIVDEFIGGNDLGRFQSSIDDGDMGLLVLLNLQEDIIEGIGKAGLLEVITGELLKGLLVEFALKIFQSKGVVQDDSIINLRCIHGVTLLDLDRRGKGEA